MSCVLQQPLIEFAETNLMPVERKLELFGT